MTNIPPILLVGFGKMGGAMLAGWRERGLAPSYAVDPMLPPSPLIWLLHSSPPCPPA